MVWLLILVILYTTAKTCCIPFLTFQKLHCECYESQFDVMQMRVRKCKRMTLGSFLEEKYTSTLSKIVTAHLSFMSVKVTNIIFFSLQQGKNMFCHKHRLQTPPVTKFLSILTNSSFSQAASNRGIRYLGAFVELTTTNSKTTMRIKKPFKKIPILCFVVKTIFYQQTQCHNLIQKIINISYKDPLFSQCIIHPFKQFTSVACLQK